jgi:hypothetical protein
MIEKTTVDINFHFFDLNLTSYKRVDIGNSSKLLKELFDIIYRDRLENKVYVIDRKEGESNDDKRNLLIFTLTFIKGIRVKGKMALLRDKLPVFLNDRSDIDEIENIKDKKLAEITHFCVDFTNNVPLVMFEFNSSGPRISDFEYYIRHVGKLTGLVKFCCASLRVKGEIEKILSSIKNVGEIEIKVKSENTRFLKDIDNSFYSSITALNDSHPYETIRLSTGFSRKKINVGGLDLARKILGFFKKNSNQLDNVEDLKVIVDCGNGFELFDLINQKESRVLPIELSSPGRPDSKDLYFKAFQEMSLFMKQH